MDIGGGSTEFTIFSDGKMKSNPIHLMQPELPSELASQVFKYLPEELRK